MRTAAGDRSHTITRSLCEETSRARSTTSKRLGGCIAARHLRAQSAARQSRLANLEDRGATVKVVYGASKAQCMARLGDQTRVPAYV